MSGLTMGYLTENELIPGQRAQGPWLTMNEVKPQFISHPLRHHQSFGGLGNTDELARVRAERAQVQAEIERLQKGGRPVVGGFQPQAPTVMAPAAIRQAQAEAMAEMAYDDRRKQVAIGLALLAVGAAWMTYRKRR